MPTDEAEGNVPGGGDTAGEAERQQTDRTIVRGSMWIAVGYGGRQALTLVSMLALVRILEPEAFGLMALAMTVLLLLEVVHESGLASALVYLRSDIERAAGTALVVSTISAVALYGGCYFVAPLLADLFRAPTLTGVLRVLSLVVIIRALALWWIIPWRPSPLQAQWGALRQLWRYSWFLSGANILILANNTIDNVVVGRVLGATQLGFYTVTYRVATMPDDVIGYIVGRVMFPVYSRLSGDTAEFGRIYVQNLQRVALLSLPVSVGVIVAAEPIVLGLLGAKWDPVITPLRILAVYALVRALAAPAGETFKGAGKPHLLTGFAALHLIMNIPCLLFLVPRYGLNGAAIGMLLPMFVVGAVAFHASTRMLNVPSAVVARALVPCYVSAAVLGLALLALLPVAAALPPVAGLAMLVVAGCCVFVCTTAVFARSVVTPIWESIRRA